MTVYPEPGPVQPLVVHTVLSSGLFQAAPPQQANLETGQLAAGAAADLGYRLVGLAADRSDKWRPDVVHRRKPARIRRLPRRDFDTVAVPLASLSVGTHICMRTNTGRISEIRIDTIGPVLGLLTVSYTTWE